MQRVLVQLEVRGDIKVQADDSEVERQPLLVEGTLDYEEKLLEAQPEPWSRHAVRYYRTAKARIKIDNRVMGPAFNSDDRIICVHADKSASVLYRPFGVLTRAQLDLLDVRGNSLYLTCLLPHRSVAIGDRWSVDPQMLAQLVGLDTATGSTVRATLVNVEGTIALIELSGTIDGAVEGVASQVQLRAKCNYDLSRTMVTWFTASIREHREIGHAEPGFDATARLRIALAPIGRSEHLDDPRLDTLPTEVPDSARLLRFDASKARVRLVHDRPWHLMLDRHDVCVFRLVEGADLVAQCNISELPDLAPGKQLALEEFQADVQRSLGGQFGQIVEASQTSGDDGKRLLRVVAAGTASGVPVQWIYYHVSNDAGRRAAIAFTLASERVERFAERDRALVASFEFLPRPQSAEAGEPAAQTADAATVRD